MVTNFFGSQIIDSIIVAEGPYKENYIRECPKTSLVYEEIIQCVQIE